MKIGIDVRLWNETGVGRYIRNLITELAQIDLENEYYLFSLSKDKEAIEKVISSRKHKWRVIPVSSHWHSLSEQTQFLNDLYLHPLDLMHFPYFSLPVLYRKPFIVTIHDLIIHHFDTGKASTLPLPMYKVKRFFFGRVLRHGLKRSEKILVPLYSVKSDLVNTFSLKEEKIIVTKEGVDLSVTKGQEKISKYGSFFLYVGNAYPHKNLETLLEAFLQYKKQKGKNSLVLIGKEDFFYTQLQKEPLYKRKDIHFLHEVTDTELSSLYKSADAYISASIQEGFGLPPLEAIANGTVPLLSHIAAFKEVIADGALYFEPSSPQGITKTMLEWNSLSSKEKNAYKEKGKKRLSLFSWKEMARLTKEAYESCASI